MAEPIIRTSPLLALGFTPVEAVLNVNGAALVIEARALGANAGRRACGVAVANSNKVVGVAKFDIPAARASVGGPMVGDEHALTVYSGCVATVTLTGSAAVPGDFLVAAAAGAVVVPAAVGAAYAQAEAVASRNILGKALTAGADGAVIEAFIAPLGLGA